MNLLQAPVLFLSVEAWLLGAPQAGRARRAEPNLLLVLFFFRISFSMPRLKPPLIYLPFVMEQLQAAIVYIRVII